jgi:replication initiator protein
VVSKQPTKQELVILRAILRQKSAEQFRAIKVLPISASARLPNLLTKSVNLHDLTGLALKVFLYLVYRYQRLPPVAGEMDVLLTRKQLAGHITPNTSRTQLHLYTSFDAALEQLIQTTIRHRGLNWGGLRLLEGYNLFDNWVQDEDSRITVITLTNGVKRALGQSRNFSLVPLADAFAIDHPRQIRLLLWATSFINLDNTAARTLELPTVAHALGLVGKVDWRAIRRTLRTHQRVVNEKTSFLIHFEPVKVGRDVTAILFTVQRKQKKGA